MHGRRIGIDARALTPPMSGVGVALREILKRLGRLIPDTELYCYTTHEAAAENLPPGPFRLRVGRGPSARWGTWWLQSGIAPVLVRDDLDLFWGPLQVLPRARRRRLGFAQVLTVQDLVFHYYPDTMSWRNRLVLKRYALPSIAGADLILTSSRTTADALTRELRVEPGRIRVVPYAAGEQFHPDDKDSARRRVAGRHGVREPYLLFVGTLEPRKNLDGLVRALSLLEAGGRFPGRLVVVGAPGWSMAPFFDDLSRADVAARVTFTGFVDDRDLPDLYRAARLFVMPSHYEGFGLPVLEAMACATPVLVTDAPPFPELAQDAAHVVAAGDDRLLAAAIDELWQSPSLRRELSRRGLRRARDFSWDHTARKVLESFEAVLERKSASSSSGSRENERP